jgi:hypothetical protein
MTPLNSRIAGLIRRIVPAQFRPIGYLESLTRRRTSCRIRNGPFAGMQYGSVSVGSAYIPKLLGIYECELSSLIEGACSKRPPLIVDIGAAEGYYAVGLAIRNPNSRVVAFETEAAGRDALHDTAVLNGVGSRIDIRGKCEVADVEGTIAGAISPFVVCDVEGYEQNLLDPASAPSLSKATILAEMHDFVVPGVTDLLRARFEPTHDVSQVFQQARSRGDFPWRTPLTTVLPESYLDWAVSEWRPVRMSWLWMEPRHHGH